MSPDLPIRVSTEIEKCHELVGRLHKMCCEPDRSPRMQRIEDALDSARSHVSDRMTHASATAALAILTDVGAQIGRLQVECCTEARLPLYAEALEHLTRTQIGINAQLGRAH